MPLTYVLDEHFRGILWNALQRHNSAGHHVIDVVRVGDPVDLPLGTKDPDVLLWGEREGRVLVSRDKQTMPAHFAAHLAAGHHSPGLFIPRSGLSVPQVVFVLVLAAHLYDPDEVRDQIHHIP